MKKLLQRQNLLVHLINAMYYALHITQSINWNNFILINFDCYLFKSTI